MKEENGMTATPVEPFVSPFYDRDGITIYNADCRDVLPQLGRFDLLLTDPPYGCGKADWDETFPTEWFRMAAEKCDTYGIITGSSGLKDSIALLGESFVDVLCGRNMNGMTRGPLGYGNWLATAVGGVKPPQGINAFEFTVSGDMPNHPSPKPIQFMRRLLARFDDKSVLDPFMGSGTTLVAAKLLGLRAVGIEINREYCKAAAERLRQGVLDFGSEG